MKNQLIIFTFLLFTVHLSGQSTSDYSIKAEFIYGNIQKHTSHIENLIKDPVMGSEIDLEWQTKGKKPWNQYFNFPVIGIGAVWLNLGNPEKLGNAFALYPYVDIPLWRTSLFGLYLKAGAGISYLEKTYYNTNTDELGNTLSLYNTNFAIGSHLNVYFSGGGSLDIPLGKGFSLASEFTWNHMSNGSFITPNTGLNLLNTFVGLRYTPNYKKTNTPVNQKIPDLSRKLSLEITLSGGSRERYYGDNKSFPIGSLYISLFKPLTNYYRLGLGGDIFYDGIFTNKDVSRSYRRTYITSDELKNKIRAGISIQNELIFGKLTAGIHIGLYLYNPIKNLEPYLDAQNGTLKKSIIYAYNIENEDGWIYTRARFKYYISGHLFASLGLKTHLQKAEFIEWGVGYKF